MCLQHGRPGFNPGNAIDSGLMPGLGKSPVGNGNPLHYSCLEYSMDRGAWGATVCGIAESDTTEHARARAHAHTHTHTHTHTHSFNDVLKFFNLFYFWQCWVFIMACRLSSIVALGLSCPVACGILVPQPRIEHVSPALKGEFLTTGPPRKFLFLQFKWFLSM